MPLKTATQKQRKMGRVSARLYRIPLQVMQVLVLRHGETYPICPRCGCTVDREYMRFCDRCGQRLGWERLDLAKEINAPRNKEQIHGGRTEMFRPPCL